MRCYESLLLQSWPRGIQSRDSGAAMANASVWFESIPRKVPRVGRWTVVRWKLLKRSVLCEICKLLLFPLARKRYVNPSILIYDFAWSHQTGNLNRSACPKKYGGWALFKSETLGFQDLFVVRIFGTWWSYMTIMLWSSCYDHLFSVLQYDVISFHDGTRKPQLVSHPPTVWSKKVWECLNSSFVAASRFP